MKKNGFTIIETLAATVLIGLLASTIIQIWTFTNAKAIRGRIESQAFRILRYYQNVAMYIPFDQLDLLETKIFTDDLSNSKQGFKITTKFRRRDQGAKDADIQNITVHAIYTVNPFLNSGTPESHEIELPPITRSRF